MFTETFLLMKKAPATMQAHIIVPIAESLLSALNNEGNVRCINN